MNIEELITTIEKATGYLLTHGIIEMDNFSMNVKTMHKKLLNNASTKEYADTLEHAIGIVVLSKRLKGTIEWLTVYDLYEHLVNMT